MQSFLVVKKIENYNRIRLIYTYIYKNESYVTS